MDFTTYKDLKAFIKDGMGSEGSSEAAEKLTDLLIEQEFFILEWNGYFSVEKWDNLPEGKFFDLWEEAIGGG